MSELPDTHDELEQRIVTVLHEARARDRAPAELRGRIEALRPAPAVRARRRLAFGLTAAGALAAVILALVLVAPGGSPVGPSLSQAAALALRGPNAPAPVAYSTGPDVRLGRDVEDVYFPNWDHLHWRAIGQREDTLDGRHAVTVFYRGRTGVIAYTIVSAPALGQPHAAVRTLEGTVLRTLMLGGRLVVTWRRSDHTCVLSGAGVPAAIMQRLAAWRAPGTEH